MFDANAPILQVGHSYLIGESQRGLLITNDVAITPVCGFLNMGEVTESVLYRANMYDDLASFLNKVHAAQVHVGDFLMVGGKIRIDLNPRLASLYMAKTWPGTIVSVFMACAQGFAVTALNGSSESFEGDTWRPLPALHHYQLNWVDRTGSAHAFTDIVEVQ
ncbi:hypothetical protein ACSA002_0490 [Salmonella phage vB_SalM_SA002]|nr:hypothetical protein ACSA002_0490 [Salmonella phage vB_SalM_SA002]